jgi:hypothetical protein
MSKQLGSSKQLERDVTMRTSLTLLLLFAGAALAWDSALAQTPDGGQGGTDGLLFMPRKSPYVSGGVAPTANAAKQGPVAGENSDWSTRQRVGVLAAGWAIVALGAAAAVVVTASLRRRRRTAARRVSPLALLIPPADHAAAAPAPGSSQPSVRRTESRRAA